MSNQDAADTLTSLLMKRRSCRAYLAEQVPHATIVRALEIAQRTASWCNVQPWNVTITSGALIAGVLGWLMAYPMLRTKGVYLVLATFAFAEVVSGIVLNSATLGGPTGITVPNFIDWYVPGVAAVIVSVGIFYLMSTRFGLNMRACHDDDVVTDLMGVNVRSVKVAAFALGAALAGFAGALYAHAFNYVEIQTFGAMVSIYVLLYVLLGGTQTPWGPMVGATFFTILPEAIRPVLPLIKKGVIAVFGPVVPATPPDDSWRFVILGICTIVMMVLRPEGLITSTMIERLRLRGRKVIKTGGSPA